MFHSKNQALFIYCLVNLGTTWPLSDKAEHESRRGKLLDIEDINI